MKSKTQLIPIYSGRSNNRNKNKYKYKNKKGYKRKRIYIILEMYSKK